jgi:hypothetical protein
MRGLLLLLLTGCAQVIGISEPRDLELSALEVRLGNTPIALEPAFDPARTAYSVHIPPAERIRVLATTPDPDVTITRGPDTSIGTLDSEVDVRPGSIDPVPITIDAFGTTNEYVVTPIVGGMDYNLPTEAIGMPVIAASSILPRPADNIAVAVLSAVEVALLFHPLTQDPIAVPGVALATGDFNNDDCDDIVVVDGPNARLIVNLAGLLQQPTNITTGNALTAVVAGDLTGDTIPDIVLADSGEVRVLASDGDSTFTAGATPAVTMPKALAIAKFDTVAGNDVVATSGDQLVLLGNDGAGNLTAQSPVPLGMQPKAIAAGDFDGDGQVDVAVLGSKLVMVTKLSTAPAVADISLASGDAIAAADVDVDGKVDIVVASQTGAIVYFNQGNGVFVGFDFTFSMMLPKSVVLEDVSGDGRRDIIVGTSIGTLVFRSERT